MEATEVNRIGSMRRNSSIWRRGNESIFSASSREEDDEEALKWAALEKLPTFDRLRRGILSLPEGSQRLQEVDVQQLGFRERKALLERLVRVTDEDNERFLLKLKDRVDRVGIDLPTIEVRFEHLNIQAEAHVGGRGLPTILNSALNTLEGIANYLHILPSRKRPLSILHDVSGIIKPRRMTLLLGPPGSGKTTLLLALAGKLSSDLKATGKTTYNGHEMNEFVPQRTAAYISQHDLHIGEMTVRETLAFSARCQGVGTRYEMLTELARREKAANIKPDPDIDVFMKAASVGGQESNLITDYVLKDNSLRSDRLISCFFFNLSQILGLEVCSDTMVGDEMLRGISGGQKKRVTTGEMLVGPARALFMDEISTGLDSSTTFQIVNSLRQSVHILGGTAAISLLQPAPETYELFDDIILLSDGQVVYQGPRENVLEFFESMGFKCPERKGVADFLQEVTSRKDQQQYWTRRDEPYRYVPVREFADAFQSFHVGRAIGDELSIPYDKSKSHPAALTTTRYGVSKKELLMANIDRELLLMKRNSFVYIFKATQLTIMALIAMTVFLRTNMHRDSVTEGGLYMGALFFGVVMVMFNDQVKKWWIWGYWISPLMYAQNAISVNEFLGHSWQHILQNSNDPLGVSVLKSRGVFPEAKWYWIGFGALIGYILLFNALFTVALTYLKPFGKSQPPVSEETLKEKHANLTGEVSEQSSRGRNSVDHSQSKKGADGMRRDGTSSGSMNVAIDQNKKGMVLPFTPLSITFDNIRYSVDMPQEMKDQGVVEDRLELLKGISGSFRPGVLTALMGVSGAGKTTLMDVLAGRKTGGYIEGNITISGYPKKQETFARVSGYCEQNDIHSPHVTVYESLVYSAWLRLPAEVNSATRKMFVDEVMELVELTPLRDALVGLPGVNGLSTEQRKRLTIAVELVANPSIIFMDEPTSGLDARAAAIVMRTVRNTVDTGRTVVCTIHQPSIDIFEAFDELFLMKRGGEEIYVGPLGHNSCHLINYFEGINGVSKIKDGYNPATWMLEVSSQAQEDILGVNFSEIYKNSELYQRNKDLIKELSTPPPGSSDLYFPTQYSQSFLVQCMACLWKQHLSYWRNPPYTAVRFFFTLIIALLFGTIFWDLGTKRDTKQDLMNAMGSMYAAVLFIGVQNSSSVQPVVAIERTVFYRERAAGMYSAVPYAFGQVAIEIPYILVQALLYGVIVYAMIGFEWTAAKFFWYMFFMYFTLLYFTFYGMMAVGLTPNYNIASIVSAAFYAIWNLFSGFIIPRPRIPVWWRWYYWICPVAWTLYGLVASQFGDIQTRFASDESDEPGEIVADFVRNYFGFKHSFLGVVAVVVVAFPVLFAFLFAFSIKTLNFQKR
ncbi:hypothetical protein C4D60_Mb01t17680 [Musa balbisiana]|uniref:ABC transporter domain-containing protein n=1 Tax=Musa balbisiana TaxID=52838 RepID=A0A4S8JPZ5_MUSBA|nr:hypothetical protein C4D60_Mb01t17680 [Musa balbisiana]